MVTASGGFGTGQVLWDMLWFFMFIIWMWALFLIFGDIFRDSSMSGWAKAVWILFVVFLPWLGIIVYLIARGSGMAKRAAEARQSQETAFRQYVQEAASDSGTGASTADELEKLDQLRARGVISDAEFQAQKSRLLASR
jgi:hypothetical protein